MNERDAELGLIDTTLADVVAGAGRVVDAAAIAAYRSSGRVYEAVAALPIEL